MVFPNARLKDMQKAVYRQTCSLYVWDHPKKSVNNQGTRLPEEIEEFFQ
jgi:hypothetical protein